MEKYALAIFVKTPGLSLLKTRLAKTIGSNAAEEFFRLSVQILSESVNKINPELQLDPYWAVAEEEGLSCPLWESFPRIWQGEGDLKKRLGKVYSELRSNYAGVFLVGADSPQLSTSKLESYVIRLREIKTPSFVLGPAVDGGFYIFGSNVSLSEVFWQNIRCSTEYAFNDILLASRELGEIHILNTEIDVDTEKDLTQLYLSMRAAGGYSTAHQGLLKWMENYIEI